MMMFLSAAPAHVLDDVVRDDEVERVVVEGQLRACHEPEGKGFSVEALVDDVDGPDLSITADVVLQRGAYDPGSGSDLEHVGSLEWDSVA